MENRLNWALFREKFNKSWWEVLEPFFTSQEAYEMMSKLNEEAKKGNKILPSKDLIFKAFSIDFDKMGIVFLGLSPYFIPGVADGYAFSCGNTKAEQPSLKVLLNCLEEDLGYKDERNPDLSRWSNQNILLLNASLTTIQNEARIHLPIWRSFIEYLWKEVFSKKSLIFVYFGKDAQEFCKFENKELHKSYLCKHPSFYARNNANMTEKPFSWVNTQLRNCGKNEIKWMEFADLPWQGEEKPKYKEFI